VVYVWIYLGKSELDDRYVYNQKLRIIALS